MRIENGMSVEEYKEAMNGLEEWYKQFEPSDEDLEKMFTYYLMQRGGYYETR